MSLKIQCLTILFSFLFGIFFYISYLFSKKLLYNRIIILKMIFSFIFCVLEMFFYYLLLEKINNGILHYYGILSFFVGVIFTAILFTKNKS